MWNTLIDADPTHEILTAWIAKEELRELLALARTDADRAQVSAQLYRFYDWCARADIEDARHPGDHDRDLVAGDRLRSSTAESPTPLPRASTA